MKIGKTTEVPGHRCLNCGEYFGLATEAGDDSGKGPSIGDISVCLYCGHLAIFEDYGLRELTPSEMDEVADEERVSAAQSTHGRETLLNAIKKTRTN
jgi:hypothetical protein